MKYKLLNLRFFVFEFCNIISYLSVLPVCVRLKSAEWQFHVFSSKRTSGAFVVRSLFFTSLLFFLGLNGFASVKHSASSIVEQNTGDVDTVITFSDYKVNELPEGWSQYVTGKGDITDWRIINDDGEQVLAQLSDDNPSYHFNDIVFDAFQLKNVELSVKIKGVAGSTDQGGGFIWRFIDADNYYVVRANPLEDNVVLYKVKNGKRKDLTILGKRRSYGVDVETLGLGWNQLKITVVDNLFSVFLNGKQIFQVKDDTFTNKGKVGLWTKADAVTYFDDFRIKEIIRKNENRRK